MNTVKMKYLLTPFLTLSYLLVLANPNTSDHYIHFACYRSQDSLELVKFYQSFEGDNWLRKDNWLLPDKVIETWYGVKIFHNLDINTSIQDELPTRRPMGYTIINSHCSPNPALDKLYCVVLKNIESSSIKVQNILGHYVKIPNSIRNGHIEFYLEGYNPGLYINTIEAGQTTYLAKVIIHK
jgi:hypothetical protein